MKLKIVAVGNKCPQWIRTGYQEFAARLPREAQLELIEIAPPPHQGDSGRYIAEEGRKILRQIHERDWVVALDERGRMATSRELATEFERWLELGSDVVFVVGGSDGLDKGVTDRANATLSLSKLTLPHYLVRVVLAEALYRAWSIRVGHPYHRD